MPILLYQQIIGDLVEVSEKATPLEILLGMYKLFNITLGP